MGFTLYLLYAVFVLDLILNVFACVSHGAGAD